MCLRDTGGGHLMVPHTQTMTKLDSDKDGVRVLGVWADSAKSSAGRWAPSRTAGVTPRAGPAGGWQEVPRSILGTQGRRPLQPEQPQRIQMHVPSFDPHTLIQKKLWLARLQPCSHLPVTWGFRRRSAWAWPGSLCAGHAHTRGAWGP